MKMRILKGQKKVAMITFACHISCACKRRENKNIKLIKLIVHQKKKNKK